MRAASPGLFLDPRWEVGHEALRRARPAGAVRKRDGLRSNAEQRYLQWSGLDFPPAEYAARRARLFDELGRLGDGVRLIPSAEGTSPGPTFRQLDDSHYWTGLELPSSTKD